MAKIVIERILALLFGTKYYINIINWRGTDKCQATEYIFRSREQAMENKRHIQETLSFDYVQTITFRSRKEY